MSAASDAILRYFREPPPRAPEDLGIVFTSAGAQWWAGAADVVEITPRLPSSSLPGSPHALAFWRGKAYEVRGDASRAASFLLVSDGSATFFVASDSRPRAESRAAVADIPDFREGHGRR